MRSYLPYPTAGDVHTMTVRDILTVFCLAVKYMKYKIKVMGYECTLTSGEVGDVCEDYALALSFFGTYDCIASDIGRYPVGEELCRLALSAFFGVVRGYPAMQLEVLYNSRALSIDILPVSRGRVILKSSCCKVLCAKSVTLPDLVTLPLTTLSARGVRVRVAELPGIGFLPEGRLASLRIIQSMPDCDAAYAVTLSDGRAECRGSQDAPLSALLTLLEYLGGRRVFRCFLPDCAGEALLSQGVLSLPLEVLDLS